MRRAWVTYSVFLAFLGAFGFFAWLTHHPDSDVLRWAEQRSWLEPWVRRFRSLYVPAERTAADSGPVDRYDIGTNPYADIPKDGVWAVGGTTIHTAPDPEARVLDTVRQVSFLAVLERRQDWARIRRDTGVVGWIFDDGSPPWGEEPAPPLPLPGRPPQPEYLALAQELLGQAGRRGVLGPYDLYTDCSDPRLLELLDVLARQVEDAYRTRYGVAPVGAPAEAVVLFAREEPYRSFQAAWGPLAGLEATGLAGRGMVALYRADRPDSDVVATLLHEWGHVLSRRALGPALPPWLDEGLADDLSYSEVGEQGRLQPERYGLVTRRHENWIEMRGAAASYNLVSRALSEGRLLPFSSLVKMPWEEFVGAEDSGLRYAQSAFLVRYLLDEESGSPESFRGFLAHVSRGEPADGASLLAYLEREWRELELGFRGWILTHEIRQDLP